MRDLFAIAKFLLNCVIDLQDNGHRFLFVHCCFYHRLLDSASTVLTATGQVNARWRILTPHRIETHEPTATKLRIIDYVREKTP